MSPTVFNPRLVRRALRLCTLLLLIAPLLIAVLAFFTGNPEVVKEIIAAIGDLFR